ncbi:helix-turn-helix transcriptional regulator [Pseudofrankia inefficax]|uniref:Transcriptional regulator, LuxR family n=1 Tax=Pseudofrankia inefficax (strain DSM 45817 / CECT 9037 / DDB 130130 / EuI1c) TaxID=298654 RepID=E3JCY3_PSEI1|nr:helix-turn-helix transcriptional regulator [Pseudofrankia inefficax]ADP81122.1 transcriptional regulator, LuxR family [Pseudofrankia inefficax]
MTTAPASRNPARSPWRPAEEPRGRGRSAAGPCAGARLAPPRTSHVPARDRRLTGDLPDRGEALARLLAAFADSQAGRGSVVVISGGPGSGRSTVLAALLERAGGTGATVLTACGSAAAVGPPGDALRQLSRDATRAAALARAGKDATGRPVVAGLAEAPPLPALVEALGARIRALAAAAPVVVAVDDVHRADEASLRGLSLLVSRLATDRVLLVATVLDGAVTEPSRAGWHTDLLRHPRYRQVWLPGLSPAGVATVLTRRLGPAAAAAAPGWWAFSAGNPTLLRALLDDARAAPSPTGAPEANGAAVGPEPGPRYVEAVARLVHAAGGEALAVARAVAVLGASGASAGLAHQVLADRAGAGADRREAALGALARAGLMDRDGFRHPAVRAAVLADIPASARRELHRRAAEVRYLAGASADEIAVHLVAAGWAGERWCLDVLRRAIESALRADDVAGALAALDLADVTTTASREADADDQRAEFTLLRLRVACRDDGAEVIDRLDPLLRALLAGRLGGAHAVTLARLLMWFGREADAERALAELERRRDRLDPRSALGLELIHDYLPVNHPRLAVASGSARMTRRTAAGVADGQTAAAVDALRLALRGEADDETVRSAQQVLQATLLDDQSVGSVEWAVLALAYAGQLELAVSWADRYLAEATRRGSRAWQALMAGVRAEIAVHQGDIRAAGENARLALTVVPAWSWGVGIGRPLSALLMAAAASGAPLDDADVPAVPEAMFRSRFGPQFLRGRASLHAARGRLPAALDDLMTAGRLLVEWNIDQPGFVPWRVDAAHVLVRLGRVDEARALAEQHLARTHGGRLRGIGLRALAATLEPPRRLPVLLAAVDLLGAHSDRLELAGALADLSEAYLVADRSARARAVARRAMLLAGELGAEPLRSRLAGAYDWEDGSVPPRSGPEAGRGPETTPDLTPPRDPGATPSTRAGLAALSPAEHRVATLAASGRTNREIAASLFVTVGTVEQHLTRVYRKLGVRGRADLRARASA